MIRKQTDWIVVRTSKTDSTKDVSVYDLFVIDRKIGCSKVRYHWIIRRCGTICPGRPADWMTYGVDTKSDRNRSDRSIQICVVGGMENGEHAHNFQRSQIASLKDLLAQLQAEFPEARVELPVVVEQALKEYNL